MGKGWGFVIGPASLVGSGGSTTAGSVCKIRKRPICRYSERRQKVRPLTSVAGQVAQKASSSACLLLHKHKKKHEFPFQPDVLISI